MMYAGMYCSFNTKNMLFEMMKYIILNLLAI